MSARVRIPAGVAPSWSTLRDELGVPGPFPPAVLEEAQAATRNPTLPDSDLIRFPFFTLDPIGSRDLDQAVYLEQTRRGVLVRYAIADVAAFVRPGGHIDAEAHRRGETLYAPDLRIPLHPFELSEGAASLLPDQVRPAVVWTVQLDGEGHPLEFTVERALIRSRRQLDYASAQADIDTGRPDEQLLLLRKLGELREQQAVARGAVDLSSPEQEVTDGPDGRPLLKLRGPLAVEGWNAEVSLLTGMLAARLMLDGGIGLLRTLPAPEPEVIGSVRRSALALGIPWSENDDWRKVLSTLDPESGPALALLNEARRLLRGAGYTVVDGPIRGTPEPRLQHSAVAAPYAHCTAPLRRLPDRYVGEICVALCAGSEVPEWATAALPLLPDEMASASRRASELERAIVDLAEALVLAPRVGETFDAVVVEAGKGFGTVQLRRPAVRARCNGGQLTPGQAIQVKLVQADPSTRTVLFEATGLDRVSS